MAMSPAERQAAYRARQREVGERINMATSATAKAALRRLARHHDTSQRELLERLIADAERATVDALADPAKYYD